MNKEKRDELKRLCEAMTSAESGGAYLMAVASFVKLARTALPELLTLVDELEAENEEFAQRNVRYTKESFSLQAQLEAKYIDQVDKSMELALKYSAAVDKFFEKSAKAKKYERALKDVLAFHYHTEGAGMTDAAQVKIIKEALADDASEKPK